MGGPKTLDIKNTYNPNLQDIQESAERTYGEANAFFEMLEIYLKEIERKVHEFSEKDIYDRSNAIASELAKCCELYLKALYIYENNIDGNNIDDIWNDLKKQSYKTDLNGNPIYLLEKNNGDKVYTYVKIDEYGNRLFDENGHGLYVDDVDNVYFEGQQGKKIKINGHQLDGLIDKLSMDSRLLLEMRMLIIPMANTEMYDEISIYDELKRNGVIFCEQKMSKTDYLSWVDQHKKTFEETRYAGQRKYNINLEFLYHLTKQIKAVAQYKINPNKNQIFDFKLNEEKVDYSDINYIGKIMKLLEINIRNDFKLENDVDIIENYSIFEEELSKMAIDVQDLLRSIDYNLISKKLVNLISKDFSAQERLSYLINSNNLAVLRDMNSKSLYNLIRFCEIDEIKYLLYICNLILGKILYNKRSHSLSLEDIKKENIATSFKMLNFNINDVINYSVYLKKKFNCRIDNNVFLTFIDFMGFVNFYYNRIEEDILEDTKNYNKNF